MATEILVNDGGAPARILPFTASGAATLSGGRLIAINDLTNGQIGLAATGAANGVGFLFTDTSSGQNCSVITGKGVMLNVSVQADDDACVVGDLLSVSANGDMCKQSGTDTVYAVAMEALASGLGFVKVVTL